MLKSNQQLSPTPGIKTTGGAGGKDGSLQFANGSITLLSPNGGETYTTGNQITIKWQTKNVASTAGIWIHLDTADGKHLNNGDLVSSWTDAPNNGVKTVTIPVDIPAGRYKLAVTVGQELEDVSDNYFTITSATPTFTQEQARTLVLRNWGGCTPDTCGSVTVSVQNNNGQYAVTAIYEGMRDDSVSAQKKVASAYYNNNVWTLGNATVTQRCQLNRGHQDFSSVPCL
ncbi:MAG: hypothetical protein HYV76_00665 [Candidatus Vogelbacteria bacterium]|nr:hypothetical protein [Candidatus Vogelbacteria bacterium]